jgi:predicted transcriptional regulator
MQEDIIIPKSNLGNLFKSIGKSEALYNKLKKKIHEDRFPNDKDKKRIAGELAMELNQHKDDYRKLEEIQQKAIDLLGVSF